jgi:hypothetical protein
MPNTPYAGAVGQSLTDYMGVHVNVKQFGAVGDGVADDTAAFQLAMDSVARTPILPLDPTSNPVQGGIIWIPPGEYKISTLDFTNKWCVTLRGTNRLACRIYTTDTTGFVFNLVNTGFVEISHLTISPAKDEHGAFLARTGGAMINVDCTVDGSGDPTGSSQDNTIRHLRIAEPYVGIILTETTRTTIEHIEFTSLPGLAPISCCIALNGKATSTVVNHLRGGIDLPITTACVLFVLPPAPRHGGIDTFLGHSWDFSNMNVVSLQISTGRLIHLTNIMLESGITQDCIVIHGGNEISIDNANVLGKRGIYIDGGTDINIANTRIGKCQQGGISLNSTSHVKIHGCSLSDISEDTDSAFDGVSVAPDVSYWSVLNCNFGRYDHNTSTMRYCVLVSSGASDYYHVAHNRYVDFGTAAVLDDGSGSNKYIETDTEGRHFVPDNYYCTDFAQVPLSVRILSQAFERWSVNAFGKHNWADGDHAPDTDLYRKEFVAFGIGPRLATNSEFQANTGSDGGDDGVVLATKRTSLPSNKDAAYVIWGDSGVGFSGDLILIPRTAGAASTRFLTGTPDPIERMRIEGGMSGGTTDVAGLVRVLMQLGVGEGSFLRFARLNALPSGANEAFVAWGDSGIGTAGDLLLIAGSNMDAHVRILTGHPTPVDRVIVDKTGLTKVVSGLFTVQGFTGPRIVRTDSSGNVETGKVDVTQDDYVTLGTIPASHMLARSGSGDHIVDGGALPPTLVGVADGDVLMYHASDNSLRPAGTDDICRLLVGHNSPLVEGDIADLLTDLAGKSNHPHTHGIGIGAHTHTVPGGGSTGSANTAVASLTNPD